MVDCDGRSAIGVISVERSTAMTENNEVLIGNILIPPGPGRPTD
jgi:hypothetical protein